MTTSLVLTVIGPDRPGLVSALAARAAAHGANWLESRMADLAGRFAGIVHLAVPEGQVEPLLASLRELESLGLSLVVQRSDSAPAADADAGRMLVLELVGQDRPGIVRDISRALAEREVSIEELETATESGSWSGEALFRARARLRVPARLEVAALRIALEAIADDLMVDLTLEEDARS